MAINVEAKSLPITNAEQWTDDVFKFRFHSRTVGAGNQKTMTVMLDASEEFGCGMTAI